MEQLSILKVLKPQGLKGELKCLPLTQKNELFSTLKTVICNNQSIKIISSVYRLGYVYICLENVNSIEDAEKFKNQILYIDKKDFGELSSNTYFIEDLEGMSVVDENGEEIGDVLGVENYGATDLLEIKDKWRTYLVPMVKQVVVNVDVDAKKVVVNRDAYEELRA